jgi:hypothetical protein
MLRVQKNLVGYILHTGFKNNGLFSPIEIQYMAEVNKNRSKKFWVPSSEKMARYLIGQSISGDNYITKWTSCSNLHITLNPDNVITKPSKGFNEKSTNFLKDPTFYDDLKLPSELVRYDWKTVLEKIINNDASRDFLRMHYRFTFNKGLAVL